MRPLAPLFLLLLALLPSPGAAQDSTTAAPPPDSSVAAPPPAAGARDAADSTRLPRFAASPLLPAEHWAVRAAWRAEALGLIRFLPAQRAVPRAEVAAALAGARAHAGERMRPLAESWWARFLEEFPEYRAAKGEEGVLRRLGSAVSAGYRRDQGRVAPVVGYGAVPTPLPDLSYPRLALRAGVASRVASAQVEGAWRGGEAVLEGWDLALGNGALQLALGRGPVGYGNGRTGGVVFSSPLALPRLELQSTRPLRLPGLLRALGPASLHLFAGPVNDPRRHPSNPALLGMRVALQPHPRLTLAASRGSMFGGDSTRTTPLRLLRMLAGVVRSDYENQVISLDGRYRLPSEAVLPATLYLEWGADDAAGAMDEEPARVMGVLLPALPGLPQAAAGAEYVYFKRGCCGHGPWYLNATLTGHWALHNYPLGHPLGGEGAEYALYAQAELLAARLRLDGRVFRADRSDHSQGHFGGANLFAPLRAGRSYGGRLDAAWRLGPRFDAGARYQREQGSGWREQHLEARLSWLH